MRLYYACRVDDWRGRSHVGNREHRQTEVPRRGTGRAGERTFPADLSRRDVPRSPFTGRDEETYRDDHLAMFLERTWLDDIRDFFFFYGERNSSRMLREHSMEISRMPVGYLARYRGDFQPPRLNLLSNLPCDRELGKAFGTRDRISAKLPLSVAASRRYLADCGAMLR